MSIGGSAAQSFADNGNNNFSYTVTVGSNSSVGAKSLPITIGDTQGRSIIDYRPVHLQPLSNDVQPFPPKARVY